MNQESSKHTPLQPNRGLYLGRLFGIRFYLDYSWFVIAAITMYQLAARFFPSVLPGYSDLAYLLLGLFTGILFFVSILLHELGHSLMSQRCGIRVPRITLLFIGGLAELAREPDDARTELKIALAGPAVSVALCGLYALAAWTAGSFHFLAVNRMFGWLAGINGVLVLFNAIPGYPLDGGRVLRALLWARDGNLRRATYAASRVGIAFSWLLMALGIFLLTRGRWDAFVYILIGIFLKNAAEGGYADAINQAILAGVRVRDVMSRDPVCILVGTALNLAVDDYFLARHHTAFPVCDDEGQFRGLLRLEFLNTVPREKWPYTSAGDLAAEQNSGALKVSADESAAKAMLRLLTPGESRLAVVEGVKLVGIITRHDILQFIKIHATLE